MNARNPDIDCNNINRKWPRLLDLEIGYSGADRSGVLREYREKDEKGEKKKKASESRQFYAFLIGPAG